MAIRPHYWSRPFRSGSSQYNYFKWVLGSRQSGLLMTSEPTRAYNHGREEPIKLKPKVRPVCELVAFIFLSRPNTFDGA